MKTVSLTMLLSLISLSFFAQTYSYPNAGMVQGIMYSGNIYDQPGNMSIKYDGDTTMCNMVYSKYCYLPQGGNYSCGTGIYYVFTRMSGLKMYLLLGGCPSTPYETIIYNWGLHVGDTMTIYRHNYTGGLATVDSTYMMTMLNGEQRRYLKLHTGTGIYTRYFRWVEGIGDIDRGFFAGSDFEGGHEIFICQQENGELIWANPNYNYDCDSLVSPPVITAITTSENINISASIFPNPFNHSSTLKFSNSVENAEINIFNMYGQKIKTIQNFSGKELILLRDDLPGGVYYIYLYQDNKIISTSRILINE